MNFREVTFMLSAASTTQFPLDQGYEVAFAGRSNAGKSSALNTLTRNSALARTSKTPGRTQQINFFKLDDERRLVDLPGYGFAKVPKILQEQWQILMTSYFEKRQSLKGIIVLMDIRHPLKEMDLQLLDFALDRTIPAHILLTKADKLSRSAAMNVLRTVEKQLTEIPLISCQLFSSLKKTGVDELVRKLNVWVHEKEVD